MNNKRSYTEYTVTTPTTVFTIGFDDTNDNTKDTVIVTLNGVRVESLGYAVMRTNDQTITITPAITSGTVRLQRETDIDKSYHQFTAGALFSAKSMDENLSQIRASQQEVRDGFVFLEYNTNGIVSASKEATAQAKAATVEAKSAATRAESAADTAVQAVGSVQAVVQAATTATATATQAASTASTAASNATAATQAASSATNAATAASSAASTAAQNAALATEATTTATARANAAADVVDDLVVGKVRAQDINTSVSGFERFLDKKLKDIVTPYDFGVRGGYNEDTLASRFNSLAEAQNHYPNAIALTEYADRVAFDAFLLYIMANNLCNVSWTCNIAIEKPLVSIVSSQTKTVSGFLNVYAVSKMYYALHIATTGFIITDGATFSSAVLNWLDMRTRCLNHGLILGTFRGLVGDAHSCDIGSINGFSIRGYAAIIGDNAHFVSYDRINAVSAGSAKPHENPELPFLQGVFSNIVNSYSKSSVNPESLGFLQRSIITVDKFPFTEADYDEMDGVLVYVAGDAHLITDIDYSDNTIAIYPEIKPELIPTITNYTLSYHYGGGLLSVGSNSATTSVTTLRTITSGMGYRFMGLYGTNIGTLITEHNGFGVVAGSYGSANHGCTIGLGYFEYNNFDAVLGWYNGSDTSPVTILNDIGLDLSKTKMMAGYTKPDGDQDNEYSMVQNVIHSYGRMYQPLISASQELTDPHSRHILYGNTHNLIFNRDKSRTLGFKDKVLYVAAKGKVTFNLSGEFTFTNTNTNTVTIDCDQYNVAVLPVLFSWLGSSKTEEISLSVLTESVASTTGYKYIPNDTDINNVSTMLGTLYTWTAFDTASLPTDTPASLTGVWAQLPRSAFNGKFNSGAIKTERTSNITGGGSLYTQTVQMYESGEEWVRIWQGSTGNWEGFVHKQGNIPVRAVPPTNPTAGIQYIDSAVTPRIIKTYTGTDWV